MNDFETHPIGTAREIAASRTLAHSIKEMIDQYGMVIPTSVHQAYLVLEAEYKKQLEGYYD